MIDEEKILKDLDRLIQRHFLEERSAAFYAKLLNIPAGLLNNITEENLGKRVPGLVRQYLLKEAKVLLSCTENNMRQITFQLNFAYPACFTHFFRRETGLTPTMFRKLHAKLDGVTLEGGNLKVNL